jgi:flavin reductase (DIM6/NTAB) family NADH-FMN oxidoreductase RutF
LQTYFYEPSKGHGLPHSPFKAIVAPRPIGWISTISSGGQVNLAPYSFFNAFSEAPPIVGFSSGGEKDSVRNARETGEFVANLATRPLAEQMNLTSLNLPYGESEMDLAGLAAAPSTLVRPPRVALASAALECKVTRIVELQDHAGRKVGSFLVLGEVVGVHIDPAYLKDGIFDAAAARTIARCGYQGDYAEVSSLFEMIRPTMRPATQP